MGGAVFESRFDYYGDGIAAGADCRVLKGQNFMPDFITGHIEAILNHIDPIKNVIKTRQTTTTNSNEVNFLLQHF